MARKITTFQHPLSRWKKETRTYPKHLFIKRRHQTHFTINKSNISKQKDSLYAEKRTSIHSINHRESLKKKQPLSLSEIQDLFVLLCANKKHIKFYGSELHLDSLFSDSLCGSVDTSRLFRRYASIPRNYQFHVQFL